MKIEIVICSATQNNYKGLVRVSDLPNEVWKVTVWEGSATQEANAVVERAAWVELSEGKIRDAVRRALLSLETVK